MGLIINIFFETLESFSVLRISLNETYEHLKHITKASFCYCALLLSYWLSFDIRAEIRKFKKTRFHKLLTMRLTTYPCDNVYELVQEELFPYRAILVSDMAFCIVLIKDILYLRRFSENNLIITPQRPQHIPRKQS